MANPEVLDTPIPRQADTVTEPARGPFNPCTGQPEAVLKTGIDPTQLIANPLPQSDNPVIIDAASGGDQSSRAAVGTVTLPGGK